MGKFNVLRQYFKTGVTQAELEKLDGLTATTAELNIMDGVTSTAAELNIMDGVTSTAAELNIMDGVTSTAAELNIMDGVTATAAELNITDNMVASLSFAAASAAANVSEVTITVLDAAGSTIAGVHTLDVWLSDAATGEGLTGTTASGTVTAKAASGAVIDTFTAKKSLRVQTLATGVFILEITDSAKTGFYVCAEEPSTGATNISTQLVSGDYGA
jgi:hypothetical protein